MQGRNAYDFQFHCPSLTKNYSLWFGYSDYILNGVAVVWGGGLVEAVPGVNGCKNNMIKEPSKFIVLADRWDRMDAQFSTTQFGAITSFGKYPFNNQNYLTGNPVSHGDGGNYLYADGHASWINWRDLRGRMFSLNSCFADNYTVMP